MSIGSGAEQRGARATRLARYLLLTIGLPVLLALGLLACGKPPHRALYLALKFTYFERDLEPVAARLTAERLDEVYPELGVFDPVRRGFTDFAGTFSVVPGEGLEESPDLEASLARLPDRLRTAFGPTVTRVAWIYLRRVEPPQITPEEAGAAATATAGTAAAGTVAAGTVAAGAPPMMAGTAETGAALPGSATEKPVPQFDPHDPSQIEALVDTTRHLKQYGFDGVQLDLEPFYMEDVPAVVTLLEALRDALGDGFIRAVFTPKYTRQGHRQAHPGFVWHTRQPFQTLLEHCERLIIPLYDYGALALDASAYDERVREVSDDLLTRLRPAERVWLALPAYRNTSQHGPYETTFAAVGALRAKGRSPGGVAVFVYTGEPEDFQPGMLESP